MRNHLDDLKRDRRPMLLLLGSIVVMAVTLGVIAYSIPERTGAPVATVDGGSATHAISDPKSR